MSEQAPSQIGRYRIVGVVGQWTAGPWTMGWVYRGHDEANRRDVLLKTLSPSQVNFAPTDTLRWSMEELHLRFRHEAQANAALAHPNIINVYELGGHEGMPFIAFERLEGQSLLQAMGTGISLKAVLPVMLQVLDGLGFMHKMGIIHRDIKPANVFICSNDRAKITGFFLAKLVQANMKGTRPPFFFGTPFYLSPELLRGDVFDGRSDLFSLGCVLHELVTGSRPFRSEDPKAIFYKVVHEDPEMELIPTGPEWKRLHDVITRALQKNPEDRYPNAGALRMDLELALKELGESAAWTPVLSRGAAGPRMH